jgi:methylated-DNA-protein-cysteine methyltransferase-like protein
LQRKRVHLGVAQPKPPDDSPDAAIRRTILAIPKGKVATYSQVAEASGYPSYHRQVCQVLNKSGDTLPWHRVLGSGGEIKLCGEAGHEQRVRLTFEGVRFRGKRVDMEAHQHLFHPRSGLRKTTSAPSRRRPPPI